MTRKKQPPNIHDIKRFVKNEKELKTLIQTK